MPVYADVPVNQSLKVWVNLLPEFTISVYFPTAKRRPKIVCTKFLAYTIYISEFLYNKNVSCARKRFSFFEFTSATFRKTNRKLRKAHIHSNGGFVLTDKDLCEKNVCIHCNSYANVVTDIYGDVHICILSF